MDNCYGSGERIPRELLHTQDDRLTNKHIQTLAFLKEMAQENKMLKERVEELEKSREQCKELHALAEAGQERIKQIQEQYLNRSDEMNQMLADQHREEMMEVMDQKMEMETTLKEEILKLRHEVQSLQRTNVELREDPDSSEEKDKRDKKITELELLVEGLQIEVKELKVERRKLQGSLEESQSRASELHQLQDLRDLNKQLSEELREANQKNLELVYHVEKLEKEKREDQAEQEQSRLVEALKNKLEKVRKEKELAVVMESEARAQCAEASDVIDSLHAELRSLQENHDKLVREHGQLCIEYGKIRRRVQQDEDRACFKDFVAVKRELISLKNENEVLKLKVRTTGGNTLPMLKEDLPPPVATNKAMTKKGKKKLLAITLAHGTGAVEPVAQSHH